MWACASAATWSPPGWGGIILNLLLIGDFYDIALRDFGLLLAALALARLATAVPARSPARP